MKQSRGSGTTHILGEGRHLRLIERAGWEFAERRDTVGAVCIVARTPNNALLMLEQYREPFETRVIEIPAGLIDLNKDGSAEAPEDAARRELLEETGWDAGRMVSLGGGPTSAGVSSERVEFFLAADLRHVGRGGGVGNEAITVHEVPLADVRRWTSAKRDAGCEVDPKIWAAIFLAAEWDRELVMAVMG